MIKNKRIQKIFSSIILAIILLTNFQNIAMAKLVGGNKNLTSLGPCRQNIEYKFSTGWSEVKCDYIAYKSNGKNYPAYCITHGKDGVDEVGDYTVDITKVLGNAKVYRVIINGFPYKTAAELGLDNDYDAYMATKQAINCIMLNRNVRKKYRGKNAAGNKIVDVMEKLVEIGKTGTEKYQAAKVTASKVNGLIEEGNNYIQEFSVKASHQISTYSILNTANLPTGAYYTDTNNNKKTTFSSGENFKLVIPKSSMTSDLNVVISISAMCKTFPVLYGKTRIADTQDYAITVDPYGDYETSTTLKASLNTGKIKILKNDAETNLPIEGVTFQLSKKDGTVIGNATTNSNGEATFSSLYQGDYILKELSTNDNYILNEMNFDVNVEYNKTATKTITNEHKRGDLKIYKIDKDNHKVVLGNVEFQLYSEEFDKVIGTYYTDVNGELEIKNLRTGNYKLIETKTNKWYNLSEDTEIEIKWDEETTKDIENELKKGQVRIIKVDEENNEIKLEGVEFEVLDEKDNVLETLITDENGEALTSRYAIRDISKLKIRETKTLDTYILSDKVETIELKENQITDIVFKNERIKGKVEITKVDKNDNSKLLEGVKFGLYDENDNLIETLITGPDGKATSKDLYKGKYYLKELDTGSVYYLLNENTFEFEIVNNGETIPLTIDNEGTDIEVTVDKEGTTEIKPGEKVDYTFSNVGNASNIYLENFKWFDFIPTDYIRIEKMTTGTWNQVLTYDVYYKTNKSEDYILFKEGLETIQDYDLDFTKLKLAKDEYVTETCFDFGKVDVGFKETIGPTMQCKSLDTLTDGETFTNETKTIGTYYGVTAEANSNWTTIVHIPEEKHEVTLPRTGK